MLTKTLATRFPTLTGLLLSTRLAAWLFIAYPTAPLVVVLTLKVSWLPWWTPIFIQIIVQVGLRIAAWRNKPFAARVRSFQRWCRFRRRLPALFAEIKGDTNPAYLIAAAPGSKRTTSAVANRLRPIGISPLFGRVTNITPQSITCNVRPAKGKTLQDLDELCPKLAADDKHIHSIELQYRHISSTIGQLTVYFGNPFAGNIPTAVTTRPDLQLVTNNPYPQDQPRTA